LGYFSDSRYTFVGRNFIAYKNLMKRWSKRKIFKTVWFSLVIFFFVWRLPQYDYRKTLKLFNLDSGSYVVGGYSQRGKMAAQIVYENPTLKDYFLFRRFASRRH